MAKKQTFADKAAKRSAVQKVNVMYVKTVKSEEGNWKFQEKFVKIDDMNQISSIK